MSRNAKEGLLFGSVILVGNFGFILVLNGVWFLVFLLGIRCYLFSIREVFMDFYFLVFFSEVLARNDLGFLFSVLLFGGIWFL